MLLLFHYMSHRIQGKPNSQNKPTPQGREHHLSGVITICEDGGENISQEK